MSDTAQFNYPDAKRRAWSVSAKWGDTTYTAAIVARHPARALLEALDGGELPINASTYTITDCGETHGFG